MSLRGVWKDLKREQGAYRVRCYRDGVTLHVASFACAVAAAQAFDMLAINQFGFLAVTNFPMGFYNVPQLYLCTRFDELVTHLRNVADTINKTPPEQHVRFELDEAVVACALLYMK
jgi:hypothetical protein